MTRVVATKAATSTRIRTPIAGPGMPDRNTQRGQLAHSRAMADVERRRVTVHGEVQGVFFRDSTREEAERRGVAGWVTNRSDGAVEAVFEGERAAEAAMVDFCREGP